MLKKLRFFVYGLMIALALPVAAQAKTLYWISHGGPADPVWTYFLQGAETWAKSTGQTVNTSFHNGDVPSQQEAIRAAIAAQGRRRSSRPAPIRAALSRSSRKPRRPTSR